MTDTNVSAPDGADGVEGLTELERRLAAADGSDYGHEERCVARDAIDLSKRLRQERDAKQAQLDRVMLEHCPEEMTPEQREEWGKHQVLAPQPEPPAGWRPAGAPPEGGRAVALATLEVYYCGDGKGGKAIPTREALNLPVGHYSLYASPPSPSGAAGLLREQIRKLRAQADNYYCKAITDRNDRLLGEDAKLATGKFGKAELNAHREKARVLAWHYAIHDACNQLDAFLKEPGNDAGAEDAEHPEVSEAIKGRERALELAARYGGVDGDHHKAWVIDQMCRAMLVTENDYAQFVAAVKHGDDGPNTHSWSEGIAP